MTDEQKAIQVLSEYTINFCHYNEFEILNAISLAIKALEKQDKIATKDKIVELQRVKKESNKRWEPEDGEDYFYISATGIVKRNIYKNDSFDERYYDFHNMFKTYEEAKFAVERWKVIRELEMIADNDKEWTEKEMSGDIFRYAIRYCEDIFGKSLYGNVFYFERMQPFYFKSKESVQEAIKIIGEDRLKKYWLGIKEE